MKNKLFILLVLTVSFLKLGSFILSNQKYFLRKFDPDFFGRLYSESQYVKGELSKGGIGDDGLYAFAGYYYFFQRGDVSSVNFEHPPLGKYLIGLSIFIFNNENVINIIYFLLLLLLTFKTSSSLLNNNLLSSLTVLFLSFNNLFLDNLLRSLLDLPFTLFFTAAIYFFLQGLKKDKYYYLSGFFLGFASSTRFFPSIVIFYLVLLLIILLRKRGQLFTFIKSSFLIPLVYLISHLSFFFYHPSLIEFLKHKKWMLAWFSGSVVNMGNIFRLIYTGKYVDPTGILVSDGHWTVLLPLVITLGLLGFRRKMFTKGNEAYLTVYLTSILFLVYVAILTLGIQKFIMPVIPLYAILGSGSLGVLYSIINSWLKQQEQKSRIK